MGKFLAFLDRNAMNIVVIASAAAFIVLMIIAYLLVGTGDPFRAP